MPTTLQRYSAEWSHRFKLALLLKQLREHGERWTQADIARAISKRLRLRKPLTGASVSRWTLAQSVPDITTQLELADWLAVDPGWLMAGARSKAPGPALPSRALSIDLTPAITSQRQRTARSTARSTAKPERRARP